MKIVGIIAVIVVDGVIVKRIQQHIETPSAQLAKPVI
jgi:hypothetical protein